MEGVKNILEKNTIVVLNEALKQGFTQLPRFVLKDKKLSFGARLTYAVLLSYAWQEDSCFPVSTSRFLNQGEVDKFMAVEGQTGGAISPVRPHADGWCCSLATSVL